MRIDIDVVGVVIVMYDFVVVLVGFMMVLLNFFSGLSFFFEINVNGVDCFYDGCFEIDEFWIY